jgi:hypothetical protein
VCRGRGVGEDEGDSATACSGASRAVPVRALARLGASGHVAFQALACSSLVRDGTCTLVGVRAS